MKKLIIFLVCISIIIMIISYMYVNYKANYRQAKRENMEYDSYLNQEIYVADLTSIINKAVDDNEKNKVQKNNKGKYIDNGSNSVNVDVKMLDYDETYNMEMFYNRGMRDFVQVYTGIKFKCTDIEYHKSTRKS